MDFPFTSNPEDEMMQRILGPLAVAILLGTTLQPRILYADSHATEREDQPGVPVEQQLTEEEQQQDEAARDKAQNLMELMQKRLESQE
jgi:hypothetical protein